MVTFHIIFTFLKFYRIFIIVLTDVKMWYCRSDNYKLLILINIILARAKVLFIMIFLALLTIYLVKCFFNLVLNIIFPSHVGLGIVGTSWTWKRACIERRTHEVKHWSVTWITSWWTFSHNQWFYFIFTISSFLRQERLEMLAAKFDRKVDIVVELTIILDQGIGFVRNPLWLA